MTISSGIRTGTAGMLEGVYRWREFWINLAVTELRERFRRSHLGIAWLIIQPLMFTAMLCAVFSLLSQQNLIDFSNYVFIGVVLWSWLSESVTLGGQTIINGQALIRQVPIPLVIFPIKTWVITTSCFAIAFVGVLVWYGLSKRHLPGATSVLLLLNLPLIGAAIFPYSVCAAVVGTLYRDFQQAVQIILQALWFVSPVFVDKSVFQQPGLREWDAVNPVSAMLSLIRDPLLENALPPLSAYLLMLAFGAIGAVLAILLMQRHEKRLIFYV